MVLLHILGSEKLVSLSVGTYIHFSYSNTAIKLKWQHRTCIRRNKFDVYTFVFFKVLPQLLQWLEASGCSLDMYPTQQKSAPSSTAIIPSLKMLLCSQGSVTQPIFKTGEGYWNKICCSEEHNIHGCVQSSLITEQILASPSPTHCTTPTSQLKPLLTPQGTKQFSIQQHVYY